MHSLIKKQMDEMQNASRALWSQEFETELQGQWKIIKFLLNRFNESVAW